MSTRKRWVTPSFDASAAEPAKKRAASRKRTQHATSVASSHAQPQNKSLTWLEKYQPETPEDLVIHPKKLKELEDWFRNYKTFGTEKYLLLHGPCGCGKTVSLRVLAKQHNFDVIEWITPLDRDYNPDLNIDDQDYQSAGSVFDQFLSRATRYPSLLSTAASKVILVKDFPNVYLQNPEALHDIVRKYLHANTYPIVFVCNDDHATRNLFPDSLRKECSIRTISFNPVHCKAVIKALQRVLDLERKSNPGATAPRSIDLDEVYQSSAGDLRSAILKLFFTAVPGVQPVAAPEKTTGAKGSKDKDEAADLFHSLGRVLYASRKPLPVSGGYTFVHNPDELVDSVSMQPATFVGFLQENYASRFSSVKDVAAAAAALSHADVLLTRFSKDAGVMALAIATRGLMVANNEPVKSFKPFVKPRFREDALRANIREEIRGTFTAFQHSPRDIILYTLPLLNKSGCYKFEKESQTKLAGKLATVFRR